MDKRTAQYIVVKPFKDQDYGAVRYGLCIHRIMELLAQEEFSLNHIESVIERAVIEFFPPTDRGLAKKTISKHLNGLFSSEVWKKFLAMCKDKRLFPEKDIIMGEFSAGRMDLLCLSDDEAIVFDYKIGGEESEHIEQIRAYINELAKKITTPVRGFLFYISESGSFLKEVKA